MDMILEVKHNNWNSNVELNSLSWKHIGTTTQPVEPRTSKLKISLQYPIESNWIITYGTFYETHVSIIFQHFIDIGNLFHWFMTRVSRAFHAPVIAIKALLVQPIINLHIHITCFPFCSHIALVLYTQHKHKSQHFDIITLTQPRIYLSHI
jgi:hypothetical protein